MRKNAKKGKYARSYKFSDQLVFLQQIFQDREAKAHAELHEEDNECDEDLLQFKEEPDESCIDEENALDASSTSSHVMDYFTTKNEKNEDSTSKMHPVDIFLAGISSSLKTLDSYNLNLAKSEIFTTVQKYEMKMILAQHPELSNE